jgi:proteasome assembly chaperone (PAC2) family protein
MFAAWPGISNVALIVATYLSKKLDLKQLAEVQAPYFFDPIGVLVKDNIIEEPQFPQSRFYYWKNSHGKNDLLLFVGEAQPTTKGYDMANCVLDIGQRFKAKRIYTCAAALTRIHHTEQPRVWGVGTSPSVTAEFGKYSPVRGGNLQIAGLNGLLLGAAKKRDIEGICLLGEVPMYATKMQNPIAALAILNKLTEILDIEIDTGELAHLASETRETMKQVAAEAMEEYIDYFTEPIWERGVDEEEAE